MKSLNVIPIALVATAALRRASAQEEELFAILPSWMSPTERGIRDDIRIELPETEAVYDRHIVRSFFPSDPSYGTAPVNAYRGPQASISHALGHDRIPAFRSTLKEAFDRLPIVDGVSEKVATTLPAIRERLPVIPVVKPTPLPALRKVEEDEEAKVVEAEDEEVKVVETEDEDVFERRLAEMRALGEETSREIYEEIARLRAQIARLTKIAALKEKLENTIHGVRNRTGRGRA